MKYPIADPPLYGHSNYRSTGGKLVEMRAKEYIRITPPLTIDEESEENIEILAEMIENGDEIDPPVLFMRGESVIDHDGRHRAYAARRLGIKWIPVIIFEEI